MLAGLDIGTTGCKIVVYDNDGNLVEKFYKDYKTNRENNVSEIDSNELLAAVFTIIKEACYKYDVDAIGIDSFGEAFVMLDENDTPLAPIILFTDHRGEEEVKYLVNKLSSKFIVDTTGVLPHQMYSLPKVMWYKNNKPEIFNKCRHILLMEDFIVYSLTGNAYIDYSLATRTMAFDIKNKQFSKEIFEASGIDQSLFSTPVKLGYNCGQIKKDVADKLNISNNTIVTVAGHDQVAVAIGSAIFNKTQAVDGAGTVECITPVFTEDADLTTLVNNNYVLVPFINDHEYVTYAFTNASGSLINWFIDNVVSGDKETAFERLENNFKEGPTGLLLLPYFAGAATPFMDANAKGAFIGLTLETTTADMYKALLEGIAYEMCFNYEIISNAGVKISRLAATGGGARSLKWLQIKADILNLPIDILSDNQSGSRGSAIAAGIALGKYKSFEEASKTMVKKVAEVIPNKENHEKYMPIFAKYKKLYSLLKGVINE